MPSDIPKIKSTFEEIKKNCKEEIEELYKTICIKCKKEALIVYAIKEHEKIIEVGYECKRCLNSKSSSKKRFFVKKPDDFDSKLLEKIEKMKIPYWTPSNIKLSYNENKFMKGENNKTIGDLFDKRALISLSMLYNEIEKIKEEKIRDIFKIIFTSNVHNVSKLNPVHQPRWKKGIHPSTSWIVHSYWVPPLRVECPVWFYFEERYKHIIDAKIDSNNQIKYYKEAKKFSDLNDGANILIKMHNALELKDIIPPNSVDYVFTDPPYGGAIQYFELSTLWASWLKIDLNYSDEITINKNQNKDFEYYHKMLRASFKEIYKVLKPGKLMTVTFHSTDIKVWNSIIKAVVMVGFELEKIIYQPPARPSAKGLLQPYGSAVGDYYIRFKKPEKEVLETEKEIDLKTYELEVVDIAKTIIGERGEPTIYQRILNGIMAELQGGRNVPVGAKNIEEVLKEHVGKKFELIPIKDENGKTIGKKWWLKGVDIAHFSHPTLTDRVERKVVEVLENNVKVSFDEILQAIFIEFPNALTPETEKINSVLKEYAIMSGGKWQLRPDLKSNLTESAHNKMIYMLALLGRKLSFDVWVGQKEQSGMYNQTKLSSLVNIKKPIWRYVNTLDWDRVNQID